MCGWRGGVGGCWGEGNMQVQSVQGASGGGFVALSGGWKWVKCGRLMVKGEELRARLQSCPGRRVNLGVEKWEAVEEV